LTPESIPDAEEIARAIAARDYRAALAEWLAPLDWTHFVTLTSKTSSTDSIWIRFERYHREVSRVAQRPVPYVAAIEESGGQLHIHALLGSTRHLRVRTIETLWGPLHRRVRVYDRTRGGLAYTLKFVTPGDERWRLSRRLPGHRSPMP
jgi:hypothetical protein